MSALLLAACTWCYHKRDKLREREKKKKNWPVCKQNLKVLWRSSFPDSFRIDSIKLRESWKRECKERAYSWKLVLRKNSWLGYSWETDQKPKKFLSKVYSKETSQAWVSKSFDYLKFKTNIGCPDLQDQDSCCEIHSVPKKEYFPNPLQEVVKEASPRRCKGVM